MKTNKPKKVVKNPFASDAEIIKPKKKLTSLEAKVDLKSKKFWKELYEDEGEELEKYLR